MMANDSRNCSSVMHSGGFVKRLFQLMKTYTLVAAETMEGIDGNTVYALPHDRLRDVLRKYGRLAQ